MSTTPVTTFRRVCDCCGSQIGDLEVAEITGTADPSTYQLGEGKHARQVRIVDAVMGNPLDVCDSCLDRELTRSS